MIVIVVLMLMPLQVADSQLVEESQSVLHDMRIDSLPVKNQYLLDVEGETKPESWTQVIDFGGAATIAVLASFLTYFLSRRLQTRRQQYIYIGLLKSIHTELNLQERNIQHLKATLDEIKKLSLGQGRFVVNSAPSLLHLEWLESCRRGLIDYEKVDMQVVHLISFYIGIARNINDYLDFTNADSVVKTEVKGMNLVKISNYFKSLDDQYVSKLETALVGLRQYIEQVLKNISNIADLTPPPGPLAETNSST